MARILCLDDRPALLGLYTETLPGAVAEALRLVLRIRPGKPPVAPHGARSAFC